MSEEKIRPGIVTRYGEMIYPTGAEWILAFALHGCQWAIDIVESGEFVRQQRFDELKAAYLRNNLGDGI